MTVSAYVTHTIFVNLFRALACHKELTLLTSVRFADRRVKIDTRDILDLIKVQGGYCVFRTSPKRPFINVLAFANNEFAAASSSPSKLMTSIDVINLCRWRRS